VPVPAAVLAGAAGPEHPAAASVTAAASAAHPRIETVLPLRSFTVRQNTGFASPLGLRRKPH
jgi:hypothetical protein